MKKILITIGILGLLLFSGCSNEPSYVSMNDFCKSKGFTNWEYANNILRDYDFKCYNKSYSNKTYLKSDRIVENFINK